MSDVPQDLSSTRTSQKSNKVVKYSIFSDRCADQKFAFDVNFFFASNHQPFFVFSMAQCYIIRVLAGSGALAGCERVWGQRQTVRVRAIEDADSSE